MKFETAQMHLQYKRGFRHRCRRSCLSSLVFGFHASERSAMLSEAHAFRRSCSLTLVIAIKRAASFSGSAFELVNFETLLKLKFKM